MHISATIHVFVASGIWAREYTIACWPIETQELQYTIIVSFL